MATNPSVNHFNGEISLCINGDKTMSPYMFVYLFVCRYAGVRAMSAPTNSYNDFNVMVTFLLNRFIDIDIESKLLRSH